MKRISLSQKQFTLVADEWFKPLMSRYLWEKNKKPVKWHASWNLGTKSFYARRWVRLPDGTQVPEWMHRRVLGLKRSDRRPTDHINHDTLNNLPENLRVVTARENAENQLNQSKWGVGIYYDQRYKTRPFRALATLDGKLRHIGMFATAEEARTARKKWLKEITSHPAH